MEKSEFHVLIKHCFQMGKNPVKAKQWLDKSYLDSALSVTMVKRWYADFKCSCADTNNAERSSRQNLAVVWKTLKKLCIHKLVLANHELKLYDITKELKISKGSVFTILYEYLSMRKLCSKWVQHFLTVYPKQQHVNKSKQQKDFCINMWQWMKHGSTTSLWSQISSQLSGQQSKATKDTNISRQGFGLCILGCARYFVHWLPWERKNHQ